MPTVKLKKQKIAAVIRKDANARRSLKVRPGEYCVIGGLLHYGGLDERQWSKCFNQGQPDRIDGATNDLTEQALAFLKKTYGLNYRQIAHLMETNDQWSDTKGRRKALLKELETLHTITWPIKKDKIAEVIR